MRQLLRHAEEILETAAAAGADSEAQAICVTRLGAIRVIAAPCGWTLAALAADAGADAVYRVERRAGCIRVDAWSRTGTCTLERQLPSHRLAARQSPSNLMPFVEPRPAYRATSVTAADTPAPYQLPGADIPRRIPALHA